MVEHGHPITGDPTVALQPVGTQLQGQLKGIDGVFTSVRPSTAMGEGNGLFEQRWEALLHPRRLGRGSYAGAVFNLSGSELVFLLVAGLVVLGPERLPGVIRRVGKVYGEVRRATSSFEKEFRDTFDAPLTDLRNTIDGAKTGFGLVDNEPSPPMRAEMPADPTSVGDSEAPTDDEPKP